MKIEIDTEKIVEGIDFEEVIKDRLAETSSINNIIDELLDDDKTLKIINRKICKIINEYISSDDGKEMIIEKFKENIENYDLMDDEDIRDSLMSIIKDRLRDLLS